MYIPPSLAGEFGAEHVIPCIEDDLVESPWSNMLQVLPHVSQLERCALKDCAIHRHTADVPALAHTCIHLNIWLVCVYHAHCWVIATDNL
jgi:hypothetical protein